MDRAFIQSILGLFPDLPSELIEWLHLLGENEENGLTLDEQARRDELDLVAYHLLDAYLATTDVSITVLPNELLLLIIEGLVRSGNIEPEELQQLALTDRFMNDFLITHGTAIWRFFITIKFPSFQISLPSGEDLTERRTRLKTCYFQLRRAKAFMQFLTTMVPPIPGSTALTLTQEERSHIYQVIGSSGNRRPLLELLHEIFQDDRRFNHIVWYCHFPIRDAIVKSRNSTADDTRTLLHRNVPMSVWVQLMRWVCLNPFVHLVGGQVHNVDVECLSLMISIFQTSRLIHQLNLTIVEDRIDPQALETFLDIDVRLRPIFFDHSGRPHISPLMLNSYHVSTLILQKFNHPSETKMQCILNEWYRREACIELARRLKLDRSFYFT